MLLRLTVTSLTILRMYTDYFLSFIFCCLHFHSGEELVLEGGLASTGRPAELVRKKKGQAISLKTGEPFVEQKPEVPSLKRAPSMENRESVMRSMARRKKDAPPMNINEKCKHCDKVFRRPCDLT